MIKQLMLIALLVSAGTAQADTRADPARDKKGVAGVCAASVDCLVLDINRQETAQGSPSARPRPETPHPAKLNLHYRYSGPGGNGKGGLLDNGSTLRSGDEFTVRVAAHDELYLYLFHFDSNGQLNELLSMSGYSNRLQAGQTVVLPSAQRHFTLDEHPGSETFHTVVATHPLDDLFAAYQKGVLGDEAIRTLAKKGITIEEDVPKDKDSGAVGRVLACLGPAGTCRETFEIEHLGR